MNLYYIERLQKPSGPSYTLKRIVLDSYDSDSSSLESEQQLEALIACDVVPATLIPKQRPDAVTLIDFGTAPSTHLMMISDSLGWVIEPLISSEGHLQTMSFACRIILLTEEGWCDHRAFEFELPTALLGASSIHQQQLREALMPLLPRYIDSMLYFCSVDDTGFLAIYRYDPSQQETVRVTPQGSRCHFFSPLAVGSMLLCGRSLNSPCATLALPTIIEREQKRFETQDIFILRK